MKITAGIANPDQYLLYAEAGADEVFCGYVPSSWEESYGLTTPLNRREARYSPVQIGGENELRILAEMKKEKKVPVALTFNALAYCPEQYAEIAVTMEKCITLGFDSFIVADPGLLRYLRDRGFSSGMRLHASGESGEINRYVVENLRMLGVERIIFHRKVGLRNMEALIRADRERHPEHPITCEAFVMNEMCHYNGAFCSGLHCDELAHPCHIPWIMGSVSEKMADSAIYPAPEENRTAPGFSGCGLCALPELKRIGIRVLKVVGRGADTEEMLRDIHALRKALDLLEQNPDAESFQSRMKQMCFPDGCGGNCYYC